MYDVVCTNGYFVSPQHLRLLTSFHEPFEKSLHLGQSSLQRVNRSLFFRTVSPKLVRSSPCFPYGLLVLSYLRVHRWRGRAEREW